MGIRKGCLTAVLVILILVGILFGGIQYRTSYAKTEIVRSFSEDGQYTLVIDMIGEPDWPFGETHCRFELLENGKHIIKYPFSIHDDGAMAHADNFNVVWSTSEVKVTVSGSEQEDREYRLKFNGIVE